MKRHESLSHTSTQIGLVKKKIEKKYRFIFVKSILIVKGVVRIGTYFLW